MSDYITTDYQLDLEAKEIAKYVFEYFQDYYPDAVPSESLDNMLDMVHESVDSSQHIIYTYRAQLIAGNCNCNDGEDWLEDIYGKPFDGCETFADVCTRLAFAELLVRSQSTLRELVEQWEEQQK